MQLQHFTSLSQKDQKEVLRTQAAYLGKRRDQASVYFLYQLEDFYIEVAFHPAQNNLSVCRCFRSMRLLDPYLSSISIKHIS